MGFEAPRTDAKAETARDIPPGTQEKYLELLSRVGQLNQEAFNELIDAEMMLSMEDNPPLSGVFYPENELELIKGLPAAEKGPALASFKDKLGRQRLAYAYCRALIERTIEQNPDVGVDRLKYIESFFGNNWGFPEQRRRIIETAVDRYQEQHEKVHALYERAADAANLVRGLTGVDVTGEPLELLEGPVSIDILTTRTVMEKLYRRGDAQAAIPLMDGFQGTSETYDIAFTVSSTESPETREVLIHEREHAKNKILREFFDMEDQELLKAIRREAAQTADPVEKRTLLEEELTLHRDAALDRAKDEITAMMRDEKSRYFDAFFDKTTPTNSYDYLRGLRERFNVSPLHQKAVQKIFVEEYESIIRNALTARAEFLLKNNFSTEAQIALLTDVPLERWPSALRHLEDYFRRTSRRSE